MKKDLHPSNYRLVVFKDMSNDYSFITIAIMLSYFQEEKKWQEMLNKQASHNA